MQSVLSRAGALLRGSVVGVPRAWCAPASSAAPVSPPGPPAPVSSKSTSAEPEPELRPINKDRSNPVPLETSLAYMASAAYSATYGDQPVWVSYRRNHKGHIPPSKTRRKCIRGGQLATGNPCPLCRDEYLVLDHRNPALLRQFVSEWTGGVLEPAKTGVCQVQHRNLLAAMHKAKEYGTLTSDVPFREYDYDEYRPKEG